MKIQVFTTGFWFISGVALAGGSPVVECYKKAKNDPAILGENKKNNFPQNIEILIQKLCKGAMTGDGPLNCYLEAQKDSEVLKETKPLKSPQQLELLLVEFCKQN